MCARRFALTACLLALSLTLRWQDNSTNEFAFAIERQLPNGRWQEIATVPANTRSYTDTNNLKKNQNYCYRVKAENSIGQQADPSNTACSKP